MRILIIGAAGQDKAHYAGACSDVLDNAHTIIRDRMKTGFTHEETLALLLSHEAVICDEIGNGVVPIDPFERLWRDEVGRICCDLAEKAEMVIRVVCGLPQLLKGDIEWKSF